jgi:hypothetical protein
VADTRPSESRPDRGYVDLEMTLENQECETVLSLINQQVILQRADAV